MLVPSPTEFPASSGEDRETQHGPARSMPFSLLTRAAIQISRARWFSFIRRLYHYQNGVRSDLGSNPLNSKPWIWLELILVTAQIITITTILVISKNEKPVWPLRIWVTGYNFGCLLSLPMLYWRYRNSNSSNRNSTGSSDLEMQRENGESRASYIMNKCRVCLELFFAIWFVMGNVWVFDNRLGSSSRAPTLYGLCFGLLAWNALSYSFPFILFVVLCCCVPLISNAIGYNMNLGSLNRGASEDQISKLPSWRFKAGDEFMKANNSDKLGVVKSNRPLAPVDLECCICLAKYMDKEELRELPCSHFFHLRCIDQWLKIISCCPLCKQELDR
ncbi:E3 ubiquitin-protein ligase At4g11680 isoform X2 [Amborella trichopoda]|uniref:RING-type domain-containing protein n=1 Tax=Amborella trichopoda TaxID=13333 RepID=U5D0R3_AMBTC|nr:E3 ubiquitin-protein ligase At4g11680 isoform X2 [Amborella trichopoda]ERN19196.1 hypothetical protein AMTR_s00061p00183390 [Amborella trichopoda]|eukprot:XP_020531156.1 E3 ubiquitin-protein ligase At4g11680 isoform X2 [Amborella trichopoda]